MSLIERAKKLKLYGLIEHFAEVESAHWVEPLLSWEETVRQQRGLQTRLRSAHIAHFKPLTQFDWQWPKKCERDVVEQWMDMHFVAEKINPILIGPNGVGKTMIACNLAYQAVIKGFTALFTTAAQMLNELSALDSNSALRRRIQHYTSPALLVIDEVGYLSYGNRHADLLFEIISQRYEKKSTCITTNRAFNEWREIFPNATCVVSIVDKLIHHAEVTQIEAESFRLKEAKERQAARSAERKSKKTKGESHEN